MEGTGMELAESSETPPAVAVGQPDHGLPLSNMKASKLRSHIYNAVRSNNVHLFETITSKLKSDYSNAKEIVNHLDDLLPEAYEELKLKNIPLSPAMQFSVEAKIIEARFYNDKDNGEVKTAESSLNEVLLRIEFLCENVKKLQFEYSGEKEVDSTFVFICRYLAQNLHILKQKLRSTYSRFPWEEMEFCLVSFISSHTRHHEFNLVSQLILDKRRIIHHLSNFANDIGQEIFLKKQVNKPFPKHTDSTIPARLSIYKSVISANPLYELLYQDYGIIRDVHSLKRIESYLNTSLLVDLNECPQLGHLAIERTLQVMGESLKNTLDSPNISTEIQQTLISSAPKDLRVIVLSLRDSLSHSHTLKQKIIIKDNKDPNFFQNIQNDLKKIQLEVCDILYEKKFLAIESFLNKLANIKNVLEVHELLKNFQRTRSGCIELDDSLTSELITITKLIHKLQNKIPDQTEQEKMLFSEVHKIIKFQETILSNVKLRYINAFLSMNQFVSIFENCSDLQSIHNSAIVCLNRMMSWHQSGTEKLKNVLKIILNIRQSIEHRIKQKISEDLNNLFYELFHTIELKAKRVGAITKFRKHIEYKNEAQTELDIIFEFIKENIEEQNQIFFQEAVNAKKDIYEAKVSLLSLLTQLIKGFIPNDSSASQNFKGLVKISGIRNTKELIENFSRGKWFECKVMVEKSRDSYTNLVDFMKNSQSNKNSKILPDALKEFFSSVKFRKPLNKCKIDVNCVLEREKGEFQSYFNKRLLVLENIISCEGNANRCVEIYEKQGALKSAIEILLLDLTEILSSLSLFSNVNDYLEICSPILIGKSLRNYLAHGDPLLDTLAFDTSVAVTTNALKFISEGMDIIYRDHSLIGLELKSEFSSKISRFKCNLAISINQDELFSAAKQGDIDKVKECVEKGADILAKDDHARTVLHLFALGNCSRLNLRLLLKENLDQFISQKDIHGQIPVHIAASSGNIHLIDFLIEQNKLNVYALGQDHATPLHLAARGGHVNITKILLENEADLESKTLLDHWTPLHFAVLEGHLELVLLLLQQGANPQCQTKNMGSSLHLSCMRGHIEVVKVLLEFGMDVHDLFDGWTPLHIAAQHGHEAVALQLLESGARVDAIDKCYVTPLHLATENGYRETVKVLLQHGGNINAQDDNLWTPMLFAIKHGYVDIVNVLLDYGATVAACGPDNWTPLHSAAYNGHNNIVEVLIKRGATVDAMYEDLSTPLLQAAKNGYKDVVITLLKNSANVNAQVVNKSTPLHQAAQNGHRDVVELLLLNGADANMLNEKNGLPLHLAAQTGKLDVVETLLVHGATTDHPSSGTPLCIAAQNGHTKIVEVLIINAANVNATITNVSHETSLHVACQNGHEAIVSLLLENGAETGEGGEFFTPLHLASQNGHLNIVVRLLEKGAKVDAMDKDNWTPLHLAAQNGHNEVVAALLDKGSNVDVLTNSKRTALHLATGSGLDETVEVLLKNGALVNARDQNKWTPIDLATGNGHTSTVKLLLQNGAEVDGTLSPQSPLHSASENGHADIVNVLLERNARVNEKNLQNATPLHLASLNGHGDIVASLLDMGSHVDSIMDFGFTPLHLAARADHLSTVIVLLERGAKVNIESNGNMTPLHLAAQRGFNEVFHALVVGGADFLARNNHATVLHETVKGGRAEIITSTLIKIKDRFKHDSKLAQQHINARDGDGDTALMWAAEKGDISAANILLKHGAEINVQNDMGFTALHWAARNNHTMLFNLLIKNGANQSIVDCNGLVPLQYLQNSMCVNCDDQCKEV